MNQEYLETNLDKLAKLGKIPPLNCKIYPKIPSTNQEVWELIDQAIDLPAVAIALEQTAGRGQWGRSWYSLPGGLYLSLALTPNLALSKSPQLNLAIAWGIATELATLSLPILLKWPNDLILHKRKLGGIKIETRIKNQTITHAVIGVGINYNNPTPETGINLRQKSSNMVISLEQLAIITIKGIFLGYNTYLDQGIQAILPGYLQFFANLGQKINFNGCPGIVTGVTEAGELQVRLYSSGASVAISLQPGTISLGYY